MDATTLLTLFLFLTALVLIGNTVLIWLAYRGFAGATTKLATAISEFEKSRDTREKLASMKEIAERAVAATETAKRKMAEFDPEFETFQARYEFFLAKVDTRVERLTEDLSITAVRTRNAIAKPAIHFGNMATGLSSALGFIASQDEDESDE